MDIETVIANTQEAVDRLGINGESSKNAQSGACHRLVLESLTGVPTSAVFFGFQQINAEEALGIHRCNAVSASYHQLDDIVEASLPGVPIIIEGPTRQHPDETHSACVMAGGDGRYIIVDTLQHDRFSIVYSPGAVLSWAQQTFDLSSALFCLVDTSLFGE